jgi:peptidoglycan/LPS O-acetylase OafA/YrhL
VLLLLVAVTVIVTLVATVPERAATIEDGPWAQFYMANWHAIAGHRDYWASFELPRMFGHLWSLAIEEQFYMVWPIVVGLIAWRASRPHRAVLVFCIVASSLSLLWMIALFNPSDPTRVYIGTDTRASSLLLGALFATAPMRSAVGRVVKRSTGAFTALVTTIAIVIGTSWFLVDGPSSQWLFRGGLFVHSLLSALLVALCAANPRAVASRSIGVAPLAMIGVLSYSLYLWHWPIYALLTEQRTNLSGWPLFGVRIAVSFAAAALSKMLIEDPVRFRAPWARGRTGVAVLVSAMAGVGAFWVLVPHPDTAPAAFSLNQFASTTVATVPQSTTVPATVAAAAPTTAPIAASTTVATVPITTTVPPPVLLAPTTRILMAGDSMAFDEWPAVAAALYAGRIAISGYVSPGAGLLDTKYPSTAEIDKAVVDNKPDLVLYQASLWDYGSRAQQAAAYAAFADFVLAHGARLAFVTIPPLRDDHRDPQLETLAVIMHEIADQHPSQVVVLNGNDIWGPVFTQDVNGDKVPERKPDGVHVCPSGAAMYAIWLMDQLQLRFAGFVPTPPSQWATGDWVDDPRYVEPAGICAALP